jgi:hypothetical protein
MFNSEGLEGSGSDPIFKWEDCRISRQYNRCPNTDSKHAFPECVANVLSVGFQVPTETRMKMAVF